jgi:hypothetical protein
MSGPFFGFLLVFLVTGLAEGSGLKFRWRGLRLSHPSLGDQPGFLFYRSKPAGAAQIGTFPCVEIYHFVNYCCEKSSIFSFFLTTSPSEHILAPYPGSLSIRWQDACLVLRVWSLRPLGHHGISGQHLRGGHLDRLCCRRCCFPYSDHSVADSCASS